MKEGIKRQIQMREKGMAVAADEVKSEDDRPAAPEERKKRHEERESPAFYVFRVARSS